MLCRIEDVIEIAKTVGPLIVAVVGIVVPALLRRTDRDHHRQVQEDARRVATEEQRSRQRDEAYVAALAIAIRLTTRLDGFANGRATGEISEFKSLKFMPCFDHM